MCTRFLPTENKEPGNEDNSPRYNQECVLLDTAGLQQPELVSSTACRRSRRIDDAIDALLIEPVDDPGHPGRGETGTVDNQVDDVAVEPVHRAGNRATQRPDDPVHVEVVDEVFVL